jgi:hypothetical protein
MSWRQGNKSQNQGKIGNFGQKKDASELEIVKSSFLELKIEDFCGRK